MFLGSLSNHSSVVYNQKMYLYGGNYGLNNNDKFYSYDPATAMWELVKTRPANNDAGNMPPALDEHSAVVHEDHMIVFGGFANGDRQQCTYAFNFKTLEWRVFGDATVRPEPRAGHSAVVHNGSMYIFGGQNNNDEKLNDVWRLDLSSEHWSQIMPNSASDDIPLGRTGHSMCIYKGHILVFGGIHEITKELNDCWAFDLQGGAWRRLFATDDPSQAS